MINQYPSNKNLVTFSRVDVSLILGTWSLFFMTWAIIHYTEDYVLLSKWSEIPSYTSDQINQMRNDHIPIFNKSILTQVHLIMSLIAMASIGLKLHCDFFLSLCIGNFFWVRFISAVLSFLSFTSFTVFMGITASNVEDEELSEHCYWFGWSTCLLLLLTFVTSFFKQGTYAEQDSEEERTMWA